MADWEAPSGNDAFISGCTRLDVTSKSGHLFLRQIGSQWLPAKKKQKSTGRESLPNRLSCPPRSNGQGTELNRIKLSINGCLSHHCHPDKRW